MTTEQKKKEQETDMVEIIEEVSGIVIDTALDIMSTAGDAAESVGEVAGDIAEVAGEVIVGIAEGL